MDLNVEARCAIWIFLAAAISLLFLQVPNGCGKCGEDCGFPYLFHAPEKLGLHVTRYNGAETTKLHHVVITADGHVIDANNTGYVQGAPPCFPSKGCVAASYSRAYRRVPSSRHFNRVLSLAGHWQQGTWHFLHESLAMIRLHGHTTTMLPIKKNMVIHVAETNAWVLAWLAVCGISAETGYTIVDGTIAAKVAIFPKLGACGQVDVHVSNTPWRFFLSNCNSRVNGYQIRYDHHIQSCVKSDDARDSCFSFVGGTQKQREKFAAFASIQGRIRRCEANPTEKYYRTLFKFLPPAGTKRKRANNTPHQQFGGSGPKTMQYNLGGAALAD